MGEGSDVWYDTRWMGRREVLFSVRVRRLDILCTHAEKLFEKLARILHISLPLRVNAILHPNADQILEIQSYFIHQHRMLSRAFYALLPSRTITLNAAKLPC